MIICDKNGLSLKSTMTAMETKKYSEKISAISERARSMIRELDYSNELIFLRVRTQKNEIMVAPDVDYYLIVVQEIEN